MPDAVFRSDQHIQQKIMRISQQRFAVKPAVPTRTGLALAATGLVLSVPFGLFAQDGSTGSEVTFGLSSTLSTTDNKFLSSDDSDKQQTTEWINRLSVAMTEQTRLGRLNASAATDVQMSGGEVETDGVELANHAVQLSFAQDTATGGFQASSSYRETELVGLTSLFDEETGETTLEEDPGRRNSFTNSLSFSHGNGTPVQWDVSVSHRAIWYEDTISTSYDDSETWTAGASAELRLSPVATVTSGVTYRYFQADDDVTTRRETSSASVGLSYEVSPIWTAQSSLGYTRIDQSGADTLDDQFGADFGFAIERDLPRGSVGLNYGHRIADLGRRNELYLSGDLAGRDVTLDYRFGVSKLEDEEEVDLVADISIVQDLPGGRITFGAVQNFATESDGTSSQAMRVSAAWDHQINSLSSFGLSATYSAVDYSAADTSDTRLTAITAEYSHSLTQDWALTGGVRYRRETDDGDGDATSHTVFMTANRDITFRR